MGFDAIWISPIIENTDGGYHGYWAKVNFLFHTPLTQLTEPLHSKLQFWNQERPSQLD